MIASSNCAARLAATLPLLLLAGVARADSPPPPPTEAQVEAARVLYRKALELYRGGQLAAAIDAALEANRTAATPVTALEAANLLVEAGRLVEARSLARGVALLAVSPRESSKGRDARADAGVLAQSLDARIPKIAFADRPSGASLVLDGRDLGAVDGTAWQGVDPGAHAIVVKMDGAVCTTISASLTEREERTFDLHGTTAGCGSEAAVSGASPVGPPGAGEGATGAPVALRWTGAIVGGAGLVAVAVGGALALGAKSDYDSVASSCPPQGCTQGAYDVRQSARSNADVATGVMLAGGVVAATGVAILLWPVRSGGRAATVEAAISSRDLHLRFRF